MNWFCLHVHATHKEILGVTGTRVDLHVHVDT